MKKVLYLFTLVVISLFFIQCEQGGLGSDTIEKHKHDYVDLGLSVVWATYNVGATSPEEYGDYFAWGETQSKSHNDYDWSTYKYGIERYEITKYCDQSSCGKNGCVDNKTILDPEDDAATINWGGKWRIPTEKEVDELRKHCVWEKTYINNVLCYKITSLMEGYTDRYIYLPASGYINNDGLCLQGVNFFYWTSSVFTKEDGPSYCALTYIDGEGGMSRCYGLSVRAVQSVRSIVSEGGNGNGDGEEVGHKYVNLGLSVKWATCNIGATTMEEYGNYFAWGETESKEIYDWSTYKYGADFNQLTKYCPDSEYGKDGFSDNKTILDLEDDAATINWGGQWRMPTEKEIAELKERCTWVWTTINGVEGYKVIGPNQNFIFLPAAGYMREDGFYDYRPCVAYWSCSLGNNPTPDQAYTFERYIEMMGICHAYRNEGRSIRPVCP